jgi:hypothetical protein
MITERRAIGLLRVFLLLLFGLLVLLQTMSLPGQFAHMAEEEPELAYLRWPMTAVTVFLVLCAEVVVVCTWRLLDLVRDDRIFSDAAKGWVDAIVWAVATAWVVLLGLSAYVAVHADDPGLPILLLLASTGIAVVGLLMVVLRALLRRATTLHTDMEAVI